MAFSICLTIFYILKCKQEINFLEKVRNIGTGRIEVLKTERDTHARLVRNILSE